MLQRFKMAGKFYYSVRDRGTTATNSQNQENQQTNNSETIGELCLSVNDKEENKRDRMGSDKERRNWYKL